MTARCCRLSLEIRGAMGFRRWQGLKRRHNNSSPHHCASRFHRAQAFKLFNARHPHPCQRSRDATATRSDPWDAMFRLRRLPPRHLAVGRRQSPRKWLVKYPFRGRSRPQRHATPMQTPATRWENRNEHI